MRVGCFARAGEGWKGGRGFLAKGIDETGGKFGNGAVVTEGTDVTQDEKGDCGKERFPAGCVLSTGGFTPDSTADTVHVTSCGRALET